MSNRQSLAYFEGALRASKQERDALNDAVRVACGRIDQFGMCVEALKELEAENGQLKRDLCCAEHEARIAQNWRKNVSAENATMRDIIDTLKKEANQ